MKRHWRRIIFPIFFVLALLLLPPSSQAGVISPDLQAFLFSLSHSEEVSVIIILSDKVDISHIRDDDKELRRSRIIRALKEKADLTQGPMNDFLQTMNLKRIVPLWIINGIAATLPASVIPELANLPGVESINLDNIIQAPTVTLAETAIPEWNITRINAPNLWSAGIDGTGTVVANLDTGVDGTHPDLQSKWRGGACASPPNCPSWFDPYTNSTTPYDGSAIGHGTGTMGIMVGDSSGGTAIGVAPGAQWIAAKIFSDAGSASTSVIHQAFQWVLAPGGSAASAPDVVNNSWGDSGVSARNLCDPTFQPDIQALKAAGIAVVFSAGNEGPNPSTSISPANLVGSFAVGATDINDIIAPFSSRGPTPIFPLPPASPTGCDGSTFPHVVAPGVNIRLATPARVNATLYQDQSGTSFAAPHVAGAMALLLSAFPFLTPLQLESLLEHSAFGLGTVLPNNDYGYGLVDVVEAYGAALALPKIGIFRVVNGQGRWYLDKNGNGVWEGTPTDSLYAFGLSGDIPVTGDWNNDGTTKIGVFRIVNGQGKWYLDTNGNGVWEGCVVDTCYTFGLSGDIPVTGDWNGDRRTKIGVYRNGFWYLDLNGNGVWEGPAVDRKFTFGLPGDIPVSGDWNGDGIDEIGVFRNGVWYLDLNGNGVWEGPAVDRKFTFGLPGDFPVAGNWNGDGKAKIGTFRIVNGQGKWYLDMNGNGVWEGCAIDKCDTFGLSGDRPATGSW